MDDNSGVPDPFYRPAYKLLAQVSSHPLAEVIDIHLEMETDSNSSSSLLSSSTIIIICHAISTRNSKIYLNWKPHTYWWYFNDNIL